MGAVDLRAASKLFSRQAQPFPGRLDVPGEWLALIFFGAQALFLIGLVPRMVWTAGIVANYSEPGPTHPPATCAPGMTATARRRPVAPGAEGRRRRERSELP